MLLAEDIAQGDAIVHHKDDGTDPQGSGVDILYLVHDVDDAAVGRRVTILRAGGARVTVAGFVRRPDSPSYGVRATAWGDALALGRTRDAALGSRVHSVIGALTHSTALARMAREAGCTVIVARNLEMLVVGAAVAAQLGRSRVRLVYECLDIHRLMTSAGFGGRALRILERRLCARADLLLLSSPWFLERYFRPSGIRLPALLVENKVWTPAEIESPCSVTAPDANIADAGAAATERVLAGPPWRVGWFGALRCAHSLGILSRVAAASAGDLVVEARGRPTEAVFGLGAAEKWIEAGRAGPGVTFGGPYAQEDLAEIYRGVDFAWAMDFYEEGANSEWLLPNRLYEACAHGAVPILRAGTAAAETALTAGVGVILEGDTETAFAAFIANLTPARVAALKKALSCSCAARWRHSEEDACALVQAMVSSARSGE